MSRFVELLHLVSELVIKNAFKIYEHFASEVDLMLRFMLVCTIVEVLSVDDMYFWVIGISGV